MEDTNKALKLTLVTVNGRTVMAYLPVDPDGRVRVNLTTLRWMFGIPRSGRMIIG